MTEVRKTTRIPLPAVPFEDMGTSLLGRNFTLSLVLCGDALAKRLNKTYRQKTYAPNVLSFPLSKSEGEIFLNIRKAAREARTLGVSTRARIALLYVHACLHLKGMRHGTLMERRERRALAAFRIN